MHRTALTLILIALSLGSCGDTNDCCVNLPGNDDLFEFSLVNSHGEDLLNPETQGSYNSDDLRVYNIVDEDTVEINNPNSDTPKGYMIFTREGKYRIRLFMKGDGSLESRGIIAWNKTDKDTIALHLVQQSENVRRLVKIVYNEEEVWNEQNSSNDERYFEIVK